MLRVGMIFLLVMLLQPGVSAAQVDSGSISLEVMAGQARIQQQEHPFVIMMGEKWSTGDSFSVVTPESSEVLITYLDGSARFRVAPRTRAEFSWNAIRLLQGDCWLRFIKRKDRFEIRTPKALLGIRGTTFRVRITADRERVDLLEGQLDIRHGDAQTILQPGEAWQLSPDPSSPHGIVCPAENIQTPDLGQPDRKPDNGAVPSDDLTPRNPVPDSDSGTPQPGVLNMDEIIDSGVE